MKLIRERIKHLSAEEQESIINEIQTYYKDGEFDLERDLPVKMYNTKNFIIKRTIVNDNSRLTDEEKDYLINNFVSTIDTTSELTKSEAIRKVDESILRMKMKQIEDPENWFDTFID